jgi:hypothetical protein
MTRFQSQVTYGLLILITGAIIAFLSYSPSRTIQYVLSVGIFLSAIFAFITAAKNNDSLIRLKYHELQGAGMFGYALAILFYASTFEKFITVTMAFLLYFGLTEIIFGFQLLQYRRKISTSIIALRMITGLLMSVGAVAIMAMSFLDKNNSLLLAGILIALGGLNFMLFANIIRKLPTPRYR